MVVRVAGPAAAAAGPSTSSAAAAAVEELPPSQRELDNLREWVLTQQWLRQQTLGGEPQAAGGAAQQLQAMQQLWEQGSGHA